MDLSGSRCAGGTLRSGQDPRWVGPGSSGPLPAPWGERSSCRLPPDPPPATHNCPSWGRQLGSEALLRQGHREQSSAAAEFLWERWPQATAWRTPAVNEPAAPLLHSKIFMDPPRESHIGAWVTDTTQEPKSNTIVPDGSGKHFRALGR